MAAVNPPLALEGIATHHAATYRKMLRGLRGQQGVIASGDMAVTQTGTPSMNVLVAAGKAVIDGTQNVESQGSYFVHNDAVVQLGIAAADGTNPRRDLVVAKVQDNEFGGGVDAWSLAVVTGTPAASPADPAAPVNSLILARVTVPALAGSIVNANITDLRPLGTILNIATATSAIGTGAIGASALAARADHVHSAVGLDQIFSDSGVLGGSLANFDVSGIPATFNGVVGRDLEIEWQIRDDTVTNAIQVLGIRFNNDSTAIYDRQRILGSAATAIGSELIAQTSAECGIYPGGGAAANLFGHGVIIIRDYASTTREKLFEAHAVAKIGTTTGLFQQAHYIGAWRSTAAIARITVLPAAGNIVAGSRLITRIRS